MKFTVEQKLIVDAVIKVASIVERKNSIPILANVLLKVEGGQLNMTSTDLDVSTSISIPVEDAVDGHTTVEASLLLGIVKKMRKGSNATFALTDNGNSLVFRSGQSSFKLRTLPPEDFPIFNARNFETSFNVPSCELQQMLFATVFAVSREETRYYLNGVYFHVVDNKLRGVATDGHRLALCDINKPDGVEFYGVIIPTKTANEVLKLLAGYDGEVSISVLETQIKFTIDGASISSKVIDGTFPEYTRIIPKNNHTKVVISSSEIARATSSVTLVSVEKTRAVAIELETNQITLRVNALDGNMAKEVIDIEYDGEKLRIGVNSKYLNEVMARLSEDVTMSFAGENDPMVISESGNDDAIYVIMPMRI